MQVLHFRVSSCGAQALVRFGGKIKHHLISYILSNISAKNYQSPFMHVKSQSYSVLKLSGFLAHPVLWWVCLSVCLSVVESYWAANAQLVALEHSDATSHQRDHITDIVHQLADWVLIAWRVTETKCYSWIVVFWPMILVFPVDQSCMSVIILI